VLDQLEKDLIYCKGQERKKGVKKYCIFVFAGTDKEWA
jgi:hypothetical protein